MFGFEKVQGMRLLSFFHDGVPENCVGMVWATPSGILRYFVHSPMGIPTYGYDVCESDGRFMWLADKGGKYLMTEEEAKTRGDRWRGGNEQQHQQQQRVNLVLCRMTPKVFTQQLVNSSGGESAAILSDGTFAPYADVRHVYEKQDQIPARPTLSTFLRRKGRVTKYNQFPEMNISVDEVVMQRLIRQLPKKTNSMSTANAAGRAPLLTNGVPWGVLLTPKQELRLQPFQRGNYTLNFTVVAETTMDINFQAFNALMDSALLDHPSVRKTSTEAAGILAGMPVITLKAFDNTVRLHMNPFRGADEREKYATCGAWAKPQSVKQRWNVIRDVGRIHSTYKTDSGGTVLCCAFQATVFLMEENQPVVISRQEEDADFRVVCTTWRLVAAEEKREVAPASIRACSVLSPYALFMMRRRLGLIMEHEAACDYSVVSWKNAPPTLDVGDADSAKQSLLRHQQGVKEEMQSPGAAILSGASLNSFLRHMGQYTVLCGLLIGHPEDGTGWGFIADVAEMLHVSDTERQCVYPYPAVHRKLLYRTCAGPTVAPSNEYRTSIVSDGAVRICLSASQISIVREPMEVPGNFACDFSPQFLRFHGEAPVLDLDTVRLQYDTFFSSPKVAVPFRMVDGGSRMTAGDTFTVISGIFRTCFFRVIEVGGEEKRALRIMPMEQTLKVFPNDLPQGDEIYSVTLAMVRITVFGKVEIISGGKNYRSDCAFATTDNNIQLKFMVRTNVEGEITRIAWFNDEMKTAPPSSGNNGGAIGRYRLGSVDAMRIHDSQAVLPSFVEGNSFLSTTTVTCVSDTLLQFQPGVAEKAGADSMILDMDRDVYLGLIESQTGPVFCRWKPRPCADGYDVIPEVTIVHRSHGDHIVFSKGEDEDLKGTLLRSQFSPAGFGCGVRATHEWTNHLNAKASGWIH
jgi:hypothetical protein